MADNHEPAPVHPGNWDRNDYPRMLYFEDGRTIVVDTPEEHDKLHQEGWDTQPAEIHQQRPPTQAPALNASDPLGTMIKQIIHEVMDERGLGKRGRYTGPRS